MTLLKIIFVLIFVSFYNFAHALDAPTNIILDEATSSELKISWNPASWAEVYAVYYWLISGLNDWYENQVVVWQESMALLENLEANSKYYIAIKSYDSNNNESWYSEEVTFNTLEEISELTIDDLILKDTRTLDLKFNVELNKDSLLTVDIINKNDDLENIEVEKYIIDSNNLNLLLYNDLKAWEKYSITIITLEWARWEVISAWVDWIIDFDVPLDVKIYWEEIIDDTELASADNTDETSTDNTQTNTTDDNNSEITNDTGNISDNQNYNTENNSTEINNEWSTDNINENNKNELSERNTVWWVDLVYNSGDEIIVESAAKTNKDLPTTWPAETFLFLIFSFIAWWLFLILRRRIKI